MADNNNTSWFGDALKGAATGLVGGLPGAVLGLGTSVIGSLFNNNSQRRNQEAANAWSEKMNLQQQQWQESMWNKNNAYNAASAQMQRLMDAGINPNNAASSVAGVNAASQMAQQPIIPSSNPMQGATADFMGDAMRGAQLSMIGQQRQQIESQTQANKASAAKTTEDMFDIIATRGSRIDLNKAQAFKNWNEGDYSYFAANEMYWNAHFAKDRNQAALDKIRAEAVHETIQSMKTDVERQTAEFLLNNVIPLQVSYTNAQIRQALAAAASSYQQAKYYVEQTKNAQKQGTLLDQQVEGGASDLDIKKLTNQYLKTELQTYGQPLSTMPIDDLTKIILNISTHNPNNAQEIINSVFDTFDRNAGYYLKFNVQKNLGNGSGDVISRIGGMAKDLFNPRGLADAASKLRYR